MTAIVVLLGIITACLLCFPQAEPVRNALGKGVRDFLTVFGCLLGFFALVWVIATLAGH